MRRKALLMEKKNKGSMRSCCRKGLWSPEEDEKLRDYILEHGHGCWSSIPAKTGLQRNGKSCRLRWINYLRPGLKRGFFTSHEEDIIINFHANLGNKWSRIAAQLPGRTDNEIKNYWNSYLKKRVPNISSSVYEEDRVEQINQISPPPPPLPPPPPPSSSSFESPPNHCKGKSLTNSFHRVLFSEWLNPQDLGANEYYDDNDLIEEMKSLNVLSEMIGDVDMTYDFIY